MCIRDRSYSCSFIASSYAIPTDTVPLQVYVSKKYVIGKKPQPQPQTYEEEIIFLLLKHTARELLQAVKFRA